MTLMSYDKQSLFTMSKEKLIKWSIKTKQIIKTVFPKEIDPDFNFFPTHSLLCTHDNKYLVIKMKAMIYILDIQNNLTVKNFQKFNCRLKSIAISKDNAHIYAIDYEDNLKKINIDTLKVDYEMW